LQDNIEPSFKIAIKNIKKGDMVIKYGEIIGRAIQDIEIGEFVHTHNLEGIRGRGDQIIQKEVIK
jgi:altronate dehydratase small subunit